MSTESPDEYVTECAKCGAALPLSGLCYECTEASCSICDAEFGAQPSQVLPGTQCIRCQDAVTRSRDEQRKRIRALQEQRIDISMEVLEANREADELRKCVTELECTALDRITEDMRVSWVAAECRLANASVPDVTIRTAFKHAATVRLWNELHKWQLATFPGATAKSKIAHLQKEVDELVEDPSDIHEHADAWMLLIGAAAIQGYNLDDVLGAIREKLEINKGRKWGEPDAQGVVEHVRDGDA